MRYDTELPQEYKTWLQLYKQLKKENLLENKEVQFVTMPRSYHSMMGSGRIYLFDVDFIKARCFDEFKSNTFTVNDLEKIQHALIDSRMIQRNDEISEKIYNSLNLLYEMGEY